MTAPDRPTAPETGVEALARALGAFYHRDGYYLPVEPEGFAADLVRALAADGWVLTRAGDGLDVERLARVLHSEHPGSSYTENECLGYDRADAEDIAAEYARLAREPSDAR